MEYEFSIEGCAKLIKDCRLSRKLTQEEFGKLIGYKKANVSKLESGKKNMNVVGYFLILEKLNLVYNIKAEL